MLIKRSILTQLRNHLSKPEITVITGPRQSGKTTLVKILQKELQEKGKRVIYFNLDIEEDKFHFTSQRSFLKKLQLELGKEGGFVFIDEVQRIKNAGLFLKGLYDMELPYKFVVTGSGTIDLKEKIQESLAGRKRVFELDPVSFEEFVNYKTFYRYEDRLKSFFEIEKEKTRDFLEEYLQFGGYPKIVTEENIREKREIIREIYNSYVEKDIKGFLMVMKVPQFSALLRFLGILAGKLLNFSSLSSQAGITEKTLKEYLYYLQRTFIIDLITPFFTNKLKELVKAPICYFRDIGMRNYAAGEFGNLYDYSFVFQNFVYLKLKKLSRELDFTIHYWRSKEKAEVDFVLRKGEEILPIEVKWHAGKSLSPPRSLRSFIKRYNPPLAIILTPNTEGFGRAENTDIKISPFYKADELIRKRFCEYR